MKFQGKIAIWFWFMIIAGNAVFYMLFYMRFFLKTQSAR